MRVFETNLWAMTLKMVHAIMQIIPFRHATRAPNAHENEALILSVARKSQHGDFFCLGKKKLALDDGH